MNAQTQNNPSLDSLSELRVKVAELTGRIFFERPEWNGDQSAIIWRLYLNFPPEGDWENNLLMVGLAGEVRRVSHEVAIERIVNGEKWHDCSPDYPSDLNACAEFEKGITQGQQQATYIAKLENQVARKAALFGWSFALITATAEQRCRAFVATMEVSEADSVSV